VPRRTPCSFTGRKAFGPASAKSNAPRCASIRQRRALFGDSPESACIGTFESPAIRGRVSTGLVIGLRVQVAWGQLALIVPHIGRRVRILRQEYVVDGPVCPPIL